MQDMDVHVLGDGAAASVEGRFFGGVDRRMRPHSYQALKCPRCESFNTKFCYYNNYNLLQPRHFCKSCRRYWTKGGVLRNVPVGGGCRKTKRSKSKSSAGGDKRRESKSNGHSSSSESSSLTASAATAAPEEGSAPSNAKSDSAVVYNFTDTRFFNVNRDSDRQPLVSGPSTDGQIFSSEIGSFSSLITSQEEVMEFAIGNTRTTSYEKTQQVNHEDLADYKMQDMSYDGLAAALNWGSGDGGRDQSMFDLTDGVNPAYWNQSQWNDNDQSLNYLP